MLIRKAVIEDASQVALVHTESWRTTYRGIITDDFLNSLSIEKRAEVWQKVIEANTQILFVAEENETIVGFSCAGRSREQNNYDSELYAIYVLKEFQGKQIGKQLVRETAKELLARGFRSMFVCVLAENDYRRFYEKLGGRLFATKEIEIASRQLIENLYGWADFDLLK